MRRVPLGALVSLTLLLAVSAYLRTRALGASLWIDEGISVGIASHPLGELPELLRQDGAPPAYYALLHGWIELAGSGDAALRVPSVVLSLLTVPAALWVGRSFFGPRAGWLCGALAAVSPFITMYAQEARMYALVGFLSTAATGAFLHAFVRSRRRYLPLFAALLALLLYTHYWALFFAFGALAAVVVLAAGAALERRPRLLVDGALAFVPPALLFAPWIPTLVFQIEHTGAPWSNPPPASALLGALALAAGAALLPRLGRDEDERQALRAVALLAAVALGAAWVLAQVEPGWATRYLAVLVGPFLLLAGATLARTGRLGLGAFVALALFWALELPATEKSNVEDASTAAAAELEPGDLVLSTQPEQVPVLAHYLPAGLRYATPLGPVADPRVMDWRGALDRLEAALPETALAPLLDSLAPGTTVLLVRPDVGDGERWRAPWTRSVLRRSAQWHEALGRNAGLVPLEHTASAPETSRTSVLVALYRKRA